jgi:hypothetical protein
MILKLLDFFFICFHTCLILFNLFGWIFQKTRLYNLITLSLTGGSWFFLGIFYGYGYCPFTEWHFQILTKQGETDLPSSYITYIINRLTGCKPNDTLVDSLTLILFLCALLISIVLNVKQFRKKPVR